MAESDRWVSKSPFFYRRFDSLMSDYPWNEKNDTFTWLSTLYNPFKQRISKFLLFFFTWIINLARSRISYDTPPLIYHVTEAVFQRCCVKKVFLNILPNSQKNTCARVSFLIKLQASGLHDRIIIESNAMNQNFTNKSWFSNCTYCSFFFKKIIQGLAVNLAKDRANWKLVYHKLILNE